MSDELIAKLINPMWAEHDGQRLVLDPETNAATMKAAAELIIALQDRIEMLKANLSEMDAGHGLE